ncbi:hypothetical protein LR69_04682 [Geobacillus sp. BCO2]|nr:hypothetical protein LR69_04682 [Geobacillus sp. BCO2]
MDKKTIAHHFSFDRRLLGRLYWFPFLVYGLCVGLMAVLSARSDEPFLPYTVIQGIAVPIAGWHLVFLYRHLYDEGAKDALVWHYRKAVVFDLVRYAVLHGGCIALLVAAVIGIQGTMFLTAPVLGHLFLLFLFYQLIGLALLGVFGSWMSPCRSSRSIRLWKSRRKGRSCRGRICFCFKRRRIRCPSFSP